MNENTCGVLHFMCLIKWKDKFFSSCTSKVLSQQNQSHLKYLEISSNKTFVILLGMNSETRTGVGPGDVAGGWSSLSELCTDTGERRWHWIQWPPQGESPPCLWWMDQLQRSAEAPQCRQTRKLMLGKEERKIREALREDSKEEKEYRTSSHLQ